ncbi:MAG: hypothetical protein QOG41_1112 [Thermoleophilaceae bacterium]|jgi:hypothetical protein|nr:hypothetical protein [Thermoleophilaceae bacterium]MEA2388339.1 hypothetical protein [Thermoleophilaceae bacterium]
MAIAIVLIALGVAVLGTAVAWSLGWAPAARGTRIGEAFLEAGQRTQDAGAEFLEWLRLGR